MREHAKRIAELVGAYFKLHVSKLVMAMWAALVPIRPALLAAILFPVIDLALALLVQARNEKIKGVMPLVRMIRSAGLKRTCAKTTLYLSGILLAFAAETYLGVPYAIRVVCGIVGVSELKSCLEHLDDLHGGPLFETALQSLAPEKPPREDQPQ